MKSSECTMNRVFRKEEFPEKIRECFEKKMEWYHAQGKFLGIDIKLIFCLKDALHFS